MKIEKFYNEEINSSGIDTYFKTLNVHIRTFRDSIKITDLKNALKVGKVCNEYTIGTEWQRHLICDFKNYQIDNKISELDFIINLIDGLYDNNFEHEFLRIDKREVKAIRTFSPFAKIKEIKIPVKWSISHIWKGILANQIESITTVMELTDDYAFDASINFNKNKSVDKLFFAREIINSQKGWYVSVKNEDCKYIYLDINLHHFDYKRCKFLKP